VKEAEEYMRAGKGPTLVHAHVTRPYSHSLSDDHSMFTELRMSLLKKQREMLLILIPNFFLIDAGFMTKEEVEELQDSVKKEVQAAMKKAIETEWPSKDTYMDHLYSMDVDPSSSDFAREANFSGKDDIPMATAINMTLKSEIEKQSTNENVW
jgi:2-oxoisovalerate dehydrogenase E1 component